MRLPYLLGGPRRWTGRDPGELLGQLARSRATGHVRLSSGGREAHVYMLFGHLFHAEGTAGTGEDVVVDALRWNAQDVTAEFYRNSRLPEVETVKADLATLAGRALHGA